MQEQHDPGELDPSSEPGRGSARRTQLAVLAGLTAGLVLLIVAFAALEATESPPPESANGGANGSGPIPGLLTGEPPWPENAGELRARLARVGIPALSEEGFAVHVHQRLDIFVNGEPVEVPPQIGIGEFGEFIAPLHTHDARAVVHVESPTEDGFTLGQFFDTWGVRLTDTCLGGYCTDATNKLSLFVDGKRVEGNPRSLRDPIPTDFEFEPEE